MKKKTSKLLEDYYKEQSEKEIENVLDNPLFDDEIVEPHVFSDEYKANMAQLFALSNEKEKHKRKQKFRSQIAAVFIIGIIISGIGVFQIEAVRNRVINFIIKQKEQSTSITISNEANKNKESKFKEYYPEYIVEGYKESETDNDEKSMLVVYKNDEDKVYYVEISEIMAQMDIDTENAQFTETEIEGYKTFISEKEDKTIIVVITDNYQITVAGEFKKEECLKVLTSIKKVFK